MEFHTNKMNTFFGLLIFEQFQVNHMKTTNMHAIRKKDKIMFFTQNFVLNLLMMNAEEDCR